MAASTLQACTVAFTSCTRSILAPFMAEITAAARLAGKRWSIRGNYYAEGSDMIAKQYQSAYGAINAVNTTQPNACMSQMGPNLAPFNSYSGYSGMQTGGSKWSRRQNNRK